MSTLIFQIFLCEDLQELLEAFFRDFKADGVEQPHKLFTGSWRLPTAAQYLGLSPKALDGSEHSYVLVKLVRNKNTQSVVGNGIRLDQEAGAAAQDVNVGDNEAILKFVKNYGTHYFRSITVGESVYQVSLFFFVGIANAARQAEEVIYNWCDTGSKRKNVRLFPALIPGVNM